MKYIDVSEFQGVIDWEAVKGSVDGVILRAGYGKNNIDKYFHRNASECNRLSIPCGAYWFSYAYTADMARLEATYLVQAAGQHRMELPLAFDWEYDSRRYAEKQGVKVTAALVRSMTDAFCQYVENKKYYCMLYANPDYINQFFGTLAGGRYDLWLAAWPNNVDVSNPPRKCGIWQWGNSRVPGIGSDVDTNEAYHDYAAMLAGKQPQPVEEKPSAPPQPWYTEAQQWAVTNKIADGTRPTEAATRAEVWQMLYNYHNMEDDSR